MNLREKALELGKTEAALRNDIRRGRTYGGKKRGNQWHWGNDSDIKPDGSYPDIEYSDRKKKHFDALQSELDAQKKQLALEQASGNLVVQADLEREWLALVDLIRKGLLELPSRFRNRVGKELTERGEQELDQLCRDLLQTLSDGAK